MMLGPQQARELRLACGLSLRAAAGTAPEKLTTVAGHSSYQTTKLYINLSGVAFREEAEQVEGRLWGGSGRKNRYKLASSLPVETTGERDSDH